MNSQPEASARFYRELYQTAAELAEVGYTIACLKGLYSFFGSWEIEVRKDHEAIRFFWDGRDGIISVEVSPARNLSYPNEWKEEWTQGLDARKGDDPLSFVVTYLRKRATG